MAASRFDQFHAAAGSAKGGQFASQSGSGTKTTKTAKGSGGPGAAGHGGASPLGKQALLQEAREDDVQAKALETELDGLQQQEHAAAGNARKQATAAAAAKKSGHVVKHRQHTAASAHHKHKAHTLQERIKDLKTKIRALREHAADLESQARAMRMDTDPVATERLHQYWVHGKGAAKIAWGAPGDFGRCVTELGKYIRDPQGYCNLAHHAALGIYPATHAADIRKAAGRATMADSKPYGDVKYADPKNGKYPVDTEAHARSAWSYINMPKNAAMYPLNGVTLSDVKDRIMAACKKFGIDVDDSASRADELERKKRHGEPEYFRTYELEDIHVVRAAQGDSTGRLVEAYAAVFNAPAEIRDFEGHYTEEIDPAAFNKVIADVSRSRGGLGGVKVMYNHGMTIHGTPSERGSMPIGVPVSITPEARGLLTVTRYSETPFADEILENIRNGAITAQSFTGRIVRSDPQLRRGEKHRPSRDGLPLVRRTELGLKEYGPTPFPAYSGAEMVGVRMSAPGTWEPDDETPQALPPDGEAAAGEPLDEHSARYHQHQLYALRSREMREALGLVW
jgi:HK97 family phage prohead protease